MSSIFNALFRTVATAATPTAAVPASASSDAIPTSEKENTDPSTMDSRQLLPTQPKTPASQSKTGAQDSPFNPGPGEHSFDITTSSMSETTDILIPRGVPFVHRRRLAEYGDAAQAPGELTPSFHQLSGTGRTPIRIRHPSDPAPAPAAKKVEKQPRTELTEWRKEQLRRQNPPRLIEPIVLRPIPTLHGPANLPYARNPSGVDSSILDDTVFAHYPSTPIPDVAELGHHVAPQSDLHTQTPQPEPQIIVSNYVPPTRSRIPYQQHLEMVHLPSTEGTVYHRAIPLAQPQGQYAVAPVQPQPQYAGVKAASKLTPSETLRAQINTVPVAQPLELISEVVTETQQPTVAKQRVVSLPTPAIIAARRIADDAGTYPTKPRYVTGSKATPSTAEATSAPAIRQVSASTIKTLSEKEAAAKAIADSKADASANWRLKTPAKPVARPALGELKLTPVSGSDRGHDVQHMTMDELVEKFAPSNGLTPLTIKVSPPPAPHSDPAVKEVSQTPLAATAPTKPNLLRPPSPTIDTPAPKSATSESIVEDLIDLSDAADENSIPKRVTRRAAKSRGTGTPGAGKLLKKGSGARSGKEDATGIALPLPGKAKSPLAPAKTVPGASAQGKAARAN